MSEQDKTLTTVLTIGAVAAAGVAAYHMGKAKSPAVSANGILPRSGSPDLLSTLTAILSGQTGGEAGGGLLNLQGLLGARGLREQPAKKKKKKGFFKKILGAAKGALPFDQLHVVGP